MHQAEINDLQKQMQGKSAKSSSEQIRIKTLNDLQMEALKSRQKDQSETLDEEDLTVEQEKESLS